MNSTTHIDYEAPGTARVVNSLADMPVSDWLLLRTAATDSHLMKPQSSVAAEVGTGFKVVQHARTVRPDHLYRLPAA